MCSCLTILLTVLVVPPMQSVHIQLGIVLKCTNVQSQFPLEHKCITIPCDGHICIDVREILHQVQIVLPSLCINLHLQGGCLSPFLAYNFYNTFSFFHLQCFAEGTRSTASSLTSISLVLSNNFSKQVSNALSASKCCWILTMQVDFVASS